MFIGLILCPLILMKKFYTFLHELYTSLFKFNVRNYDRDYCVPKYFLVFFSDNANFYLGVLLLKLNSLVSVFLIARCGHVIKSWLMRYK